MLQDLRQHFLNGAWLLTLQIVIQISFSAELDGQACGETYTPADHYGTSGDFFINETTSLSGQDFYFRFINATDLLILEIDLYSVHDSRNCFAALDYIVVPDGEVRCFTDNFCGVYKRPGANLTRNSSSFNERVSRRCSGVWNTSLEWPPTLCIRRRLKSFHVKIHFAFLSNKLSSKKSNVKEKTHDQVVSTDEPSQAAIVAAAVTLAVIFILSLVLVTLFYVRKKRSQRQSQHADIDPYAVHVSIRRRSEMLVNGALTGSIPGNHDYDIVPTETTAAESEYLRPIAETPYCEIDDSRARIPIMNPTYEITEEPEVVGDTGNTASSTLTSRPGWTHHERLPLPGGENFRSSVGATSFSFAADSPNSSTAPALSTAQLHSQQGEERTPYGEIIGTINDDGSVNRFRSPSDHKYKSVRKNRKKSKSEEN